MAAIELLHKYGGTQPIVFQRVAAAGPHSHFPESSLFPSSIRCPDAGGAQFSLSRRAGRQDGKMISIK